MNCRYRWWSPNAIDTFIIWRLPPIPIVFSGLYVSSFLTLKVDIWFYPEDTRLHIATSLNHFQNWWVEIPAIPMNEWTRVEVSQLRGQYEIRTGGKIRTQATNHYKRTFDNVKLFTAHDAEYVIANARVDNVEMNTWESLIDQNAYPPQENVPVNVAQCGWRYEDPISNTLILKYRFMSHNL